MASGANYIVTFRLTPTENINLRMHYVCMHPAKIIIIECSENVKHCIKVVSKYICCDELWHTFWYYRYIIASQSGYGW